MVGCSPAGPGGPFPPGPGTAAGRAVPGGVRPPSDADPVDPAAALRAGRQGLAHQRPLLVGGVSAEHPPVRDEGGVPGRRALAEPVGAGHAGGRAVPPPRRRSPRKHLAAETAPAPTAHTSSVRPRSAMGNIGTASHAKAAPRTCLTVTGRSNAPQRGSGGSHTVTSALTVAAGKLLAACSTRSRATRP